MLVCTPWILAYLFKAVEESFWSACLRVCPCLVHSDIMPATVCGLCETLTHPPCWDGPSWLLGGGLCGYTVLPYGPPYGLSQWQVGSGRSEDDKKA